MKVKPLVSILIPVYNTEKYIGQCIKSVLDQTYDNLEVIIVNDNTPDKSIDIVNDVINSYKEQRHELPKIKIINHYKNRGLTGCRNTGLEHANGEYIVFLDSDDYLNVDSIQLLVSVALKTDADIVRSDYNAIFEDGREVYHTLSIPTDKNGYINAAVNWCSIPCSVWANIYKKSLFDDNNIKFIEGYSMGEDYYINSIVAFYVTKIVMLHESTYNYRINPTSMTKKFSYNHANDLIKYVTSIEEFYKHKNEYPLFKKNIDIAKIKIKSAILVYLSANKKNINNYKKIFYELNNKESSLSGFSKFKIRILEFSPLIYRIIKKISPSFRNWN